MRCPEVYKIEELRNLDVDEETYIGVWRPARPINLASFSLKKRILTAWFVFTGRLDAVDWYIK